MADTIGSEGRPPAARPRWVRVAAGVAVAAVVGWLAVRAGGAAPEPTPPVAVPTSVAPAVPPSPTPLPEAPVFRLNGEPGTGPAVQLLVAGNPPAVLDVRTGRSTPLPGLAGLHPDQVLLRRGDGFTTALVFDLTERLARGLVLPDGGRPVELGRVVDLLPRRDGTVLTVVCLPGGAGGCVLANRTTAGAVRWQRSLVSAPGLVRDTPYGLLLSGDGDDLGALLRLEDARTGQVRRVLGGRARVLTADDRRVVYEQDGDCLDDCPLVVATLADGSRTRLTLMPGRPSAAALSPDGRRLALGYQGLQPDDPAPTADRSGHAVVVELAGGGWSPVVGLATGADMVPVPVWTPAGDLLLAATDEAGAARLVLQRPGAERLVLLPVRLPRFPVGPGQVLLRT